MTFVLVGRAAERAGIHGLLRSTRESRGGVLLLRGVAGVGKTALLDQVATDPGFRVLRATGVEAESDLAYATAHQLLHPLLPLLDELPDAQASAVRVALGMGDRGTPDRFLVALGFLSLVSEAAREGPVVLVLDDVQWSDTASLDAVLFLGRRIGAEPVALLLAAREEPGAHDDTLRSLTGLPGLTQLRVDGLPETDVGALMAEIAGVAPAEQVTQTLAERTDGNPLALVELVRFLTPDQIAGRQPLPRTLPLGERLERSFLARAEAFSSAAQGLLLVAAAEPSGELDLLMGAAGLEGPDQLVEEVEASGLARYDGGRLVFTHPLARSAVYGDATTQQRRMAHLGIADVLRARGEADRSVWHQAAATLGADEAIAKALDEVARRALERSGCAAAAAAYERAAELSATAAGRTERLIAAADAAWLAGQTALSKQLLDRADQTVSEPSSRGRLLGLRARAASRNGDVKDAHRLFVASAELLRESSPGEALAMLAEAVEAASYIGDVERLTQIVDLLSGLAPTSTPRERFLAAWVTVGNAGLRGSVAEDADQIRAALALGDQLGDPRLMIWAGIAALQLGDVAGMQRYYARALEQARGAGAAASLPYALEHSAMSLAFAGRYGCGAIRRRGGTAACPRDRAAALRQSAARRSRLHRWYDGGRDGLPPPGRGSDGDRGPPGAGPARCNRDLGPGSPGPGARALRPGRRPVDRPRGRSAGSRPPDHRLVVRG